MLKSSTILKKEKKKSCVGKINQRWVMYWLDIYTRAPVKRFVCGEGRGIFMYIIYNIVHNI